MCSHAQLPTRDLHARPGEKYRAKKVPFMPLVPVVPSKINDKFRVANRFVQFKVCFHTVNMKKLKCKHCPISGCGSKFLVKLSNHLRQVHELTELERKYWLQFAKLQNTNMVRVYENEVEPWTKFL